MSKPEPEFGSPQERNSTVYLEHVAGFEVPDVSGADAFITVDDLEDDADVHPTTLRGILRGEHGEVSSLSGEFLLRNLVIPNLPIGFYGDTEGEPVILGIAVGIRERNPDAHPTEYTHARGNTALVKVIPTLGRLSRVSYVRNPQLGGYGADWFDSDHQGVDASFFGGMIVAEIKLDQRIPDVIDPDDPLV